METHKTSNGFTYRKIKNIEGYYGGVYVMTANGKYYWLIEGPGTDFRILNDWFEIDKDLYDALVSYNDRAEDIPLSFDSIDESLRKEDVWIGNIVEFASLRSYRREFFENSKYLRITLIDNDDYYLNNVKHPLSINELKGVLLKEEHLEKIGFEFMHTSKDNINYYTKNGYNVYVVSERFVFESETNERIYFVHELQNK